jgi:hypothetical protein
MDAAQVKLHRGDVVQCIDPVPRLIRGSYYTVDMVDGDTISLYHCPGLWVNKDRFKLIRGNNTVPVIGFPPGHYATFTPESDEQPPSPISVQVGGDHYRKMAIQPMTYILANDIPFAEGCVIKYVSRWKNKGGLQDLKKARQNLDFLIEREEKKVSQ